MRHSPSPYLLEGTLGLQEGDGDEEWDTAHGGARQEPADEVAPGWVHVDVVVSERCVLAQGEEESGLERQREGPTQMREGARETLSSGLSTVKYQHTGASRDAAQRPSQTVGSEGREGRRRSSKADKERETNSWEIMQADRQTDRGAGEEGMEQELDQMVVLVKQRDWPRKGGRGTST